MTETELSVEAKVMLGGIWSRLGDTELSFRRPHIITDQARKGLDDLVEAGFLNTWTHDNPHNDTRYWKPTYKMKDAPKIPMSFLDENNFDLTTE